MAKFNIPQAILPGRKFWVMSGRTFNDKLSVSVHDKLPYSDLELHDVQVYEVITNLSLEDFRLGSGFFTEPRDWLSFAKRTGAEQVEPKSRENDQLEFIICPNCNTMQEPGNSFCIECSKPLGN